MNIGTFGILEAVSGQVCGKGSIFWVEMANAASGAAGGQAGVIAAPRQEMQNWVSFPNFLLAEHWTQLQSSDRQLQKLDTIVNHLIRLGLRHPSERTQATLAALVSHVGPNAWDASDVPDTARQTALLSTVKAVLKGQLLRTRNMALPLPGGYIRDLPASVQELPLGMQAECFPAGAVAPPMDLNPIWQVAHGWAVPSTHRARAGGQVALVGAASSADAASIATQAAVSTVLALVPHVQRGPVDAIPGLQIFGAARRENLPMATVPGQILGKPLFGLQLKLRPRQQELLHRQFWIGFPRLLWPWKTDVHQQRQWLAAPGKMSAPMRRLRRSVRMCRHPLLCRQQSKGIAKNRRIWS